jgi:hypothetical protein
VTPSGVTRNRRRKMKKDLLARLRNTQSVNLPGGVVRGLSDEELNSVAGGQEMIIVSVSKTCGQGDDCLD